MGFEQIRQYKLLLKKERTEKREMKQRLVNAFEHSKKIKDQHQHLLDKVEKERLGWRRLIRKVQDRHREEIALLQVKVGSQSEAAQERMRQVIEFGERVMQELTSLQDHLHGVKEDVLSDDSPRPVPAPTASAPDSSFFITQPAGQ